MFGEAKIDCHCHVLDPARFPYAADTSYQPSGQEIAPVDSLIRTMDLYGVRHALLVGTNSGYGNDLSPVHDALARGEGRFRGIAVVPNTVGADTLASLKAIGFVGVAFNVPFHGFEFYAHTGDLLRKLADLDMVLNVQARDDQWPDVLRLLDASNVRVLIDHCGRPAPERGLTQPGFQAVLELGRTGRACVKLSGFGQFSRERYPYADAHPFVAALLEAFTPAACLWGSDWPFLRAPERMDYAPLLQLLAVLIPDAVDRRSVLWETPRRLFGFGG
ncbi:MAG: amidohydrolase family protein [Proteobacteria bacterium]|nr:amidohydrolase family protein [Pseudomonadota bacterium]